MTHTLRNQNSINTLATAMENLAKESMQGMGPNSTLRFEAEIVLTEQLPRRERSTNVNSGGQQLARSRTQNRQISALNVTDDSHSPSLRSISTNPRQTGQRRND